VTHYLTLSFLVPGLKSLKNKRLEYNIGMDLYLMDYEGGGGLNCLRIAPNYGL
jgi:hypothetical protein